MRCLSHNIQQEMNTSVGFNLNYLQQSRITRAFGNAGFVPDFQCPRVLQHMFCIAAFEQGRYYHIRHWTRICPELHKAGHAARIVYFA